MKVLIECNNDFEAKLIVGRLENEGIKAVTWNENEAYKCFMRVRVAVNEEDYNQALKIISVDGTPDETWG